MAYPVLDAVAAPPQRVVLEIENLEASVDVLDELGNLHWAVVVAQGDGVPGQTGLIEVSM